MESEGTGKKRLPSMSVRLWPNWRLQPAGLSVRNDSVGGRVDRMRSDEWVEEEWIREDARDHGSAAPAPAAESVAPDTAAADQDTVRASRWW